MRIFLRRTTKSVEQIQMYQTNSWHGSGVASHHAIFVSVVASGVAEFDASRSGGHQEEELDGCAGGSIIWLVVWSMSLFSIYWDI